MPKKPFAPTKAWRNQIFSSPPRRDISASCKSTTKIPVFVPHQQTIFYAEGGNECTAFLLLKYFQALGLVSRFKSQPFAYEEIGGPADRIPDILVETTNEDLLVIECKSWRFITSEVQAKFDQGREFLEPLGISHHVWTDRNKVGRPISQNVRLIDRGLRMGVSQDTCSSIEEAAKASQFLGPLISRFGWDDVFASLAHGAFFLDIQEKFDEASKVFDRLPRRNENYFFERTTNPLGWWDALPA